MMADNLFTYQASERGYTVTLNRRVLGLIYGDGTRYSRNRNMQWFAERDGQTFGPFARRMQAAWALMRQAEAKHGQTATP